MKKNANTRGKGNASPGMVLDAAAKMMLNDKTMLANLCNAMIYEGQEIVMPEMIEPRPVELNALIKRSDGRLAAANRFRDLAFFVNISEGRGFMLCIEIQGKPDWRMPIRVHEYNIREYARLEKERNYGKNRKLPLVVTIVFNFSHSEWRCPRSFLDIAEYKDGKVERFSELGNISLIDPYHLEGNFYSHLCTDWKIVLCSFPASKKKAELQRFANEIKGTRLRKGTLDFLKVYFNMDLDIINEDETGGQIKMCRAFTEIRREGYRSGQRKGRKKGREEMLHNIIASAISNNVGFEVIQTLTGLSLDEITSIAKTLEPAQA